MGLYITKEGLQNDASKFQVFLLKCVFEYSYPLFPKRGHETVLSPYCYNSSYLRYKPKVWCGNSPGTLQYHPYIRHLASVIPVK